MSKKTLRLRKRRGNKKYNKTKYSKRYLRRGGISPQRGITQQSYQNQREPLNERQQTVRPPNRPQSSYGRNPYPGVYNRNHDRRLERIIYNNQFRI